MQRIFIQIRTLTKKSLLSKNFEKMGPREFSDRLAQLRSHMVDRRRFPQPLDALMVPMIDAHNSEYIASCDARIAFISGFTGSAGSVIITQQAAALWTDGRYHLQASRQLDPNLWTLQRQGTSGVPTQTEWLVQQLKRKEKETEMLLVGVHQHLISPSEIDKLQREFLPHGLHIFQLTDNLIDLIWGNSRPARPNKPLRCLSVDMAGRHWSKKIHEARADSLKAGAHVSVFSALDDVAWMLNLRGADIDHNPVFFAYLIVAPNNVSHLCVDANKLTPEVRIHLTHEQEQIHFHDYDMVSRVLENVIGEDLRCCADSKCNVAVLAEVPEQRRIIKPVSWAANAKAVKNAAEVAGMRRCHVEDAVALCEYLYWLENAVHHGKLVTEISGAEYLDGLRAQQSDFVSLSFSTISSAGSNGAIIHYKPTNETDRAITADELYLCDSGGQYVSGTTDVTRTVYFGASPTSAEQEAFTRVLTAHADLARCVFPAETLGSRLDVLARHALWSVGLDFAHGTGHGVGAFLNVHEGPCGISGSRAMPHEVGLCAGMIVTIEPGLYLEGRFGVRIENVVLVTEAQPTSKSELLTASIENGSQRKGCSLLRFEPLTLVPIQRNLVNPVLLSEANITWLNNYHTLVRETIGPELLRQGKRAVYEWLMLQTEPLG